MSEFSNFLVLDLVNKNLVLNLQDNKNNTKKNSCTFISLWSSDLAFKT